MSSLADLPQVVGFFSYSRDDDEDFGRQLSSLRDAIQKELAAALGRRNNRDFRLWQDQDAISPGEMWETEIASAINQATFFIPIVTPRAVGSEHCKFEFDAFLVREKALGRNNLVFPILYITVPALAEESKWRTDPVLSIIGARQFVDWRKHRQWPTDTPAYREAISEFCAKIAEALREPWVSPEERRRQEEDARLRREAELRNRAKEGARRKQAEEERERQEAEKRNRGSEEVDRISLTSASMMEDKTNVAQPMSKTSEDNGKVGIFILGIMFLLGVIGSYYELTQPPKDSNAFIFVISFVFTVVSALGAIGLLKRGKKQS